MANKRRNTKPFFAATAAGFGVAGFDSTLGVASFGAAWTVTRARMGTNLGRNRGGDGDGAARGIPPEADEKRRIARVLSGPSAHKRIIAETERHILGGKNGSSTFTKPSLLTFG